MATNFKIGTDPELIFTEPDGRLLFAGDFLPHDGEFGRDGHPYLAEVRPSPGTPTQVAKNLKAIFTKYRNGHPDGGQAIPDNVLWRAGSFVCEKPLGGHIHFAVPYSPSLSDALDKVLMTVISCLEDADEARRRRAGNYGQLSNIRAKTYGFEYRTPGSWIVSESISIGVMALAKAIIYEEINDGLFSLRKLPKNTFSEIAINRTKYVNADRAYFFSKMDVVAPIIRGYSYWQTQEGKNCWRYVAGILDVIKKHESWHNGRDILERWNIIPSRAKKIPDDSLHRVIIPSGTLKATTLWNIMHQNDLVEQQRGAQQGDPAAAVHFPGAVEPLRPAPPPPPAPEPEPVPQAVLEPEPAPVDALAQLVRDFQVVQNRPARGWGQPRRLRRIDEDIRPEIEMGGDMFIPVAPPPAPPRRAPRLRVNREEIQQIERQLEDMRRRLNGDR